MKDFLKKLRSEISYQRTMAVKERDLNPVDSIMETLLNGRVEGFNQSIYIIDQQIKRL